MKYGYVPHFLQLLQFSFVNSPQLESTLQHNYSNYSGLIITSPRIIEAIRKLISSPHDDINPSHTISDRADPPSTINTCNTTTPTTRRQLLLREWRNKPIFCLGKETPLSIMEEFELLDRESNNSNSNSDSNRNSTNNIHGKDQCSSATELANYIIEYFHSSSTTSTANIKPLLFLCGNRRRDDLPNLLHQHNIPLQEMIVYQTEYYNTSLGSESSNPPEDLSHLVNPPIEPSWIVFFSPSGVEALEETILLRSSIDNNNNNNNNRINLYKEWFKTVKIGAIGQTTASAIREIFGFDHSSSSTSSCIPHAIATKPNAISLMEAILLYERQQTRP